MYRTVDFSDFRINYFSIYCDYGSFSDREDLMICAYINGYIRPNGWGQDRLYKIVILDRGCSWTGKMPIFLGYESNYDQFIVYMRGGGKYQLKAEYIKDNTLFGPWTSARQPYNILIKPVNLYYIDHDFQYPEGVGSNTFTGTKIVKLDEYYNDWQELAYNQYWGIDSSFINMYPEVRLNYYNARISKCTKTISIELEFLNTPSSGDSGFSKEDQRINPLYFNKAQILQDFGFSPSRMSAFSTFTNISFDASQHIVACNLPAFVYTNSSLVYTYLYIDTVYGIFSNITSGSRLPTLGIRLIITE